MEVFVIIYEVRYDFIFKVTSALRKFWFDILIHCFVPNLPDLYDQNPKAQTLFCEMFAEIFCVGCVRILI